jgi:hypothetical protein
MNNEHSSINLSIFDTLSLKHRGDTAFNVWMEGNNNNGSNRKRIFASSDYQTEQIPLNDISLGTQPVYYFKFQTAQLHNGYIHIDDIKLMNIGGRLSVTPDGNHTIPIENQQYEKEFSYQIENTGNTAIEFQISTSHHWLTISNNSGVLQPQESETIVVNINEYATKLSPGAYTATVHFSNSSNGIGNARRFIYLNVLQTNFIINAEASSGGMINPSGEITAEKGETITFSIEPDDCYRISDVSVDGSSNGNINAYTLVDINGNHSIDVKFSPEKYNIEIVQTEGGKITIEGNTYLDCGSSICFTVVPDEGYTIQNVLIDKQYIGPKNSHCIQDIHQDHTVEAIFEWNNDEGALSITDQNIRISGHEGGPFTPESQTITLKNIGWQPITVTLSQDQPWISLSHNNVTLQAKESLEIDISINDHAYGLFSNTYRGLVSIENITNGRGSTEQVIDLWVYNSFMLVSKNEYGAHYPTIRQTMDGGYLVNNNDDLVNYVQKYDISGKLEWISRDGVLFCGGAVLQASNNDYILNGLYLFQGGNNEGLIMKLNDFGKTEWIKSIPEARYGSICEIQNDEFVLAGKGPNGFSLVKFNNEGNIVFGKTIEEYNSINWINVHGPVNNSFIVAGEYEDKIIICKFDFSINLIWTKTIACIDGSINRIVSIGNGLDDNLFICGNIEFSDNRNTMAFVTKFDSIGNIEWTKIFGAHCYDANSTSDNGFIVGGAIDLGDEYCYPFFLKMDNNGNFQWAKKIKTGNYHGWLNSVQETSEKGFILSAYGSKTNDSVFIIKSDENGELNLCDSITPITVTLTPYTFYTDTLNQSPTIQSYTPTITPIELFSSPYKPEINYLCHFSPVISTPESFYTLTYNEGELSIDIQNTFSGPMDWTASTNDEWFEIIQGSTGSGEGSVTIRYNTNYECQRNGVITINVDGAVNSPYKIHLLQKSFSRDAPVQISQVENSTEEINYYSVSISNEFAIVGISYEGSMNQVSIYYKENQWVKQTTIQFESNVVLVKISDQYAFVNTINELYIYYYNGYNWILQNEFESENYEGLFFMDISNNYALINTYQVGPYIHNPKAYIYKRENNSWKKYQEIHINPSNNYSHNYTISSISNNYIILTYRNTNDDHSGEAYLYKREEETFKKIKTLLPSDETPLPSYGEYVSISDDYAFVASRDKVYIYKNNDDLWEEDKIIPFKDKEIISVSTKNNYAFIGYTMNIDGEGKGGEIAVFKNTDGEWSESTKLHGCNDDLYYQKPSIEISDKHAIIGGWSDKNGILQPTADIYNLDDIQSTYLHIPINSQASPYTVIFIPIHIENPDQIEIQSIDIELAFDASKLTISEVSFDKGILRYGYSCDWNVKKNNQLVVSIAQTESSLSVSESGTIAYIKCRAVGERGDRSDFSFNYTETMLNDMKVKTYNGQFLINSKPVAESFTITAQESTPVSITLKGSDSDSDTLSYTIQNPMHGSLNQIDSVWVYTPETGFYGEDTFSFIANDGIENSEPAIIKILVNGKPVADPKSVVTANNSSISFQLTGSDKDGDPLTFQILSTPQHGNITGNAPHIIYTPEHLFAGKDQFSFKVNDGIQDSDQVIVEIIVNDKPVANPLSITTLNMMPINMTLTGSDPNNDLLTFHIISEPQHGKYSGQAPDITYTPNQSFLGIDQFEFIVNDGLNDSNKATVMITVHPYRISGGVNYYQNNIAVPDVSLLLTGLNSYTVTTNTQGNYLFSDQDKMIQDEYILTPSLSKHLGGLHASDASRIQRYIVGKLDLTCHQKIAADVSRNRKITSLDVSNVAIGVSRINAGLSHSLNDEGINWTFLANEINQCNEWPPIVYTSDRKYEKLTGDLNHQDFFAIRLGDIDGDWSYDSKTSRSVKNKNKRSDIQECHISVKKNSTLTIPVILVEEQDIEGVDVVVQFDTTVLSAETSLEKGILAKDFQLVKTETDELISVVIYGDNIHTGNGEVLFLTFKVNGEINTSSEVILKKFICNGTPVKGQFKVNEKLYDKLYINVVPDEPPVISKISDQIICNDTATEPIKFTVTDNDTAIEKLIISGYSDDFSIVSDNNDHFEFSGFGNNRTVKIFPTTNNFDSVSITITVKDENNLAETSFILYRNKITADINCDGYVTWDDLILALQILSSIDTGVNVNKSADINNDRKIGWEEIIHIISSF